VLGTMSENQTRKRPIPQLFAKPTVKLELNSDWFDLMRSA
jgi:hypothetical protein